VPPCHWKSPVGKIENHPVGTGLERTAVQDDRTAAGSGEGAIQVAVDPPVMFTAAPEAPRRCRPCWCRRRSG